MVLWMSGEALLTLKKQILPFAEPPWEPAHHITEVRKAETRCWCKDSALLSLSLCDFSQSRLLINFQIINVKVIVTPVHSGADIPAPINIPVSGCRSGWYDTRGLIPSLPYHCCRCHVNFSPGGSQMPSKSASSTAGEMPFNCLQRCRTEKDSVQSRMLFIICEEWGSGVETVHTSCNLMDLFALVI